MKKLIILAAALQLTGSMAAQINLTNNLVICMPMNGNANDYSGNGNNGIVTGATPVPGMYGQAYKFNGVSDFIRVAASSSIEDIGNNSELTISAWCYIHNWYQSWNVFAIFDRYNPTTDMGWDYTIQAPVGCPEQYFNPNWPAFPAMCNFSGPGTTVFGTWVHYAITYSKANNAFKAYKNASLVATIPVNGLALENTVGDDVFIGYSPSGPNEFSDGIIDELMVYNRELNSSEILALYYGYGCLKPYDGQDLGGHPGEKITGIKEISSTTGFVSLYPNPASNNLNVEIKSITKGDILVTIKSYDGKQVMVKTLSGTEATTHTLDVSSLPKGIYLVTISDGNQNQNLKFVKE